MLSLFDSSVRKNALVGFDAELLSIWARSLILDELLVLFVRFRVRLLRQLFNVLFKVFLAVGLNECHCVLLHLQLLQVFLNIFDRLLIFCKLLFFLKVVVAEVASIQNIVFERIVMIGQRLYVMRPNEPPLTILGRHRILNILQVIVRWQVEVIARRDVIVNELGAILNYSEPLARIILLAILNVDEVSLDVVLLLSK